MRVTFSEFAQVAPTGVYYYHWELVREEEEVEVDLRELTKGLPPDRHANEKRWMADQIGNAARVNAHRSKRNIRVSCRAPYDAITLRSWPKA